MLPDAGPPAISAVEPMHDCCPDEGNPCDKSAQSCAFMAACVCSGFWAASYVHLAFPLSASVSVSLPASAALHARAVGPPFRPPRS